MKCVNNRGDTIVEVLLAVVIVGTVLSGAFVAIQRSLNASQQAQERSQATKLAEIQLERIKSVTNDAAANIFAAPVSRTFCLDNTVTRKDFASPPPARDADLLAATPSGNYPPNCIVDSAGNTFSAASNSIPFYVSVERDSANVNQFAARVRWLRAGGNGREEAAITYRVYP